MSISILSVTARVLRATVAAGNTAAHVPHAAAGVYLLRAERTVNTAVAR